MRFIARPALLLLLVSTAAVGVAAQDHQHGEGAVHEAPGAPPLYDDLGSHEYPITAAGGAVQEYFDQGLRLYYAFNHAEAIRSFQRAQELDQRCAMCWWGEALAWGPNINLPMDEPSGRAAFAAIREAMARRNHVTAKERDLIEALAVRYEADPPEDRARLDRAYADAMTELAARYPDDAEVRVLHAEAMMDLSPWDYWTEDAEPRAGIDDALAGLQHVQAIDANHPGACHFYIHAVEKLFPERAVACAERLAGLMPGAGHLVHMPGHIYIRVGRYHDAVRANEHAIHADETYIQDQRPGMGMYTAGYYPHNYDFLAFASMMIGRGDASISAADRVADLLPKELFGTPGMDFLQHWSARPLLFRIRFERWDEILATPAPPSGQPHALAMWRYAQGRALAAQGDVSGANAELEGVRRILRSGALEGTRMEFNQSPDLIAIAERVLSGRVAAAAGRFGDAVDALTEAGALEDGLLYGEPPEWSIPTRHDLGEVLLDAGRPADAERAFRADLDHFPGNGWSLRGLSEALGAQGRAAEAAAVDVQFREVWEGERPRLTRGDTTR